jgi:hypothetical protein
MQKIKKQTTKRKVAKMKPNKKVRVRRAITTVIYLNTSQEFRDKFASDAKKFGLSRSAFGNMCVTLGHKIITSNLDEKKIPLKK